MTIIVLLHQGRAHFRYGVDQYDKEKLKSVGDENLFRVLGYDRVIWYSPTCRIIFQSLRKS
jgi:hypothetical protein